MTTPEYPRNIVVYYVSEKHGSMLPLLMRLNEIVPITKLTYSQYREGRVAYELAELTSRVCEGWRMNELHL